MNSNADIIEQLTEAYESLCDIGGAWERDIVLEAINQIKRLRVEIDLKGSRLDDAYAEVERLRAEVSRMDCTCLPYAEPHDGMCSRCMALRGPS